MQHRWLLLVALLPAVALAQTERGPFARIAIMRALDGQTVDLEAGYIRHLENVSFVCRCPFVSKMTIEIIALRPNMLVKVTPSSN